MKEGKLPIKTMVLVGVSIGHLMDCFGVRPPWWKTALEGSMIFSAMAGTSLHRIYAMTPKIIPPEFSSM